LDKPFAAQAKANLDGASMAGLFHFAPVDKHGGGWSFAGAMDGLPVTAIGGYKVLDPESATPSIHMDGGIWQITVPLFGSMPLGEEGDHLGGAEIIKLEPATEGCP
jgi:hypothetical protein